MEKDEAGHDVLPAFKEFLRQYLTRGHLLPEWLVTRLTDVISMRRQQFYYQRAHKRHMSYVPFASQEKPSIEGEPLLPMSVRANASITTKSKTVVGVSPPRPSKSRFTEQTFDTFATELKPGYLQENIPNVDGPTKTEIVGRYTFPGLPKNPIGKDFECYQCFYILPASAREDEMWRLTLA